MAELDLRLRVPSPGLLSLPWLTALADWDPTVVPFRDIPVGASRHLVRFVEVDGVVWALKELPLRLATREYDVLRGLEDRSLPAVRVAGVVVQPFDDDRAILVTRYLDGSWQYRRLLLRVPTSKRKHRQRLLDAMAALLVDLHRNGVFWGDCSLANTLFKRDGQLLQAWMVDAETSEIHATLTEGQRATDLDILVDNVIGGLVDVAARLDEPPEVFDQLVDEVDALRRQYQDLWDLLHEEPTVRLGDQWAIESRIRRLNDLGYAVDEVRLVAAGSGGSEAVRLRFAVAERGFHAEVLRRRTGLDVGEGQATVLLNDLLSYETWAREAGDDAADDVLAGRWLAEVVRPGTAAAFAARGGVGDPVQAYCDLLEVRWLLSERAGADVGDGPALAALHEHVLPAESAAEMSVADERTGEVPVIEGPAPGTGRPAPGRPSG